MNNSCILAGGDSLKKILSVYDPSPLFFCPSFYICISKSLKFHWFTLGNAFLSIMLFCNDVSPCFVGVGEIKKKEEMGHGH